MSLLVDATIVVSLILSLALTATLLLGRSSAAVRHWLLAAAVLAAIAAPAFRPIAPSLTVRVSPPAALQQLTKTAAAGDIAPQRESREQRAAAVPSQRVDLAFWLASIWIGGVAVNLLLLLVGLVQLARIASRAEPVTDERWSRLAATIASEAGVKRPVELLRSSHPTVLFTWGFARPRVMLPAASRDWSDDRIRVVLLHELAHVGRGDWLTQLLAELLRAAYWFNPIAWLASRRLRLESEHACDDVVLSGGVRSDEYARHLLELARAIAQQNRRGFADFPAPAMARPSSLERRFTAMLNTGVNRAPVSRPARAATIAAVLIVSILIAGLGTAQTFVKFSGNAFDATNRYLPGVKVYLTNTQTQAKYEVGTDKTGRFEFVGLPPGDYTWQTELPGFATLKGAVSVSGRDVQQDLVLQVGSLEETISVVGAPAEEDAAKNAEGDRLRAAARMLSVASARTKDNACMSGGVGPTGGQIKAPMQLGKVNPQYPQQLAAQKIGGVVVLQATIGADGDVHEVKVVRDPHPDLSAAAVEAVRQWQYSITRLNCEPIDVKMTVTVNFRGE